MAFKWSAMPICVSSTRHSSSVRLLPLILALLLSPSSAEPAVYGLDHSGGDYKITPWSSPPSMSANHWAAAAAACEASCVADTACCSWTYCTPEGGAADPERCCLKGSVPPLRNASTHWTGSPRSTCTAPPPPPFPGPPWLAPTVHNSPACTHLPNWHDIAGALYYQGAWHVFQGSAGCAGVPPGWHHAVSTNLVDWVNLGIEPGLSALPEPAGYGSSSPCSGFMVLDDAGVPCAGFRQCSGRVPGSLGLPLELRCATNANLTAWGPPEYPLGYTFFFNRPLPYDPVRPWKDSDGQWYATISADSCNATEGGCAAGGREYLYTSPALRGPSASWRQLPQPLYASNWTVFTGTLGLGQHGEFVTAGYFGALPGDPRGGATRCLTNNLFELSGDTAFFCGTQATPGGPLLVNTSDSGAAGMIDWGCAGPRPEGSSSSSSSTPPPTGIASLQPLAGGPYKMARTLSPASANQVAAPGRKVMTAWLDLGEGASAQALPRDLSLDAATGALLQAFSPELQALRASSGDPEAARGQAVEVVADFTIGSDAAKDAVFGVLALASEDGLDALRVTVDLGRGLVVVGEAAGPLVWGGGAVHVHLIVDHCVASAIVNNRTAVTRRHDPRDAASNRVQVWGVDGSAISVAWSAWVLRNAVINGTL
jgi:hypothetical protein